MSQLLNMAEGVNIANRQKKLSFASRDNELMAEVTIIRYVTDG